jgi:hypothetical protein
MSNLVLFDTPFVVGAWWRRLLGRDWIGRRKGVLERFIERLFLAPASELAAIAPLTLLFGTHSTSQLWG